MQAARFGPKYGLAAQIEIMRIAGRGAFHCEFADFDELVTSFANRASNRFSFRQPVFIGRPPSGKALHHDNGLRKAAPLRAEFIDKNRIRNAIRPHIIDLYAQFAAKLRAQMPGRRRIHATCKPRAADAVPTAGRDRYKEGRAQSQADRCRKISECRDRPASTRAHCRRASSTSPSPISRNTCASPQGRSDIISPISCMRYAGEIGQASGIILKLLRADAKVKTCVWASNMSADANAGPVAQFIRRVE